MSVKSEKDFAKRSGYWLKKFQYTTATNLKCSIFNVINVPTFCYHLSDFIEIEEENFENVSQASSARCIEWNSNEIVYLLHYLKAARKLYHNIVSVDLDVFILPKQLTRLMHSHSAVRLHKWFDFIYCIWKRQVYMSIVLI